MPPWNPLPKPNPAMTVPTKKPGTERAPIATSVTATPTSSATMPATITARGGAARRTYTDAAPTPARTNRLSPPYTTESESARLRTSDGPSEA